MLTAKQHQTYQFVRSYILKYGYAPTEAEIAKGIGIKSRGVVHRYITALCKEGYLHVIPNKRRNIRLVEEKAVNELPLIGKIAAGSPIEAIEENHMFNFSERLMGSNRFLLQVRGDSMIGDNICDGDFIICESCQGAEQGSIVVALIDQQEATLKRFKRNADDTITLIPSNETLSPQIYDAARITIQGKFVGLLRFPY